MWSYLLKYVAFSSTDQLYFMKLELKFLTTPSEMAIKKAVAEVSMSFTLVLWLTLTLSPNLIMLIFSTNIVNICEFVSHQLFKHAPPGLSVSVRYVKPQKSMKGKE